MVDTRDLKSLGPQGLYGFESRPGHGLKTQSDDIQRVGFLCTLFLSQNCPNNRENDCDGTKIFEMKTAP